MKDELVEKLAMVAKAKIKEAVGGKPLLGDTTSGDWYSETGGGSIDLCDIVRACLSAIEAEGYVVVPRDEMDRLRNERDTLNDLLVEYGDALGRANTI